MGEMMILVGYPSTGGYKLFDATNMRVVIRRDVVFHEMKLLQQSVSGYVKAVIDYNFENSDPVDTGSAKMPVVEALIEENMRRSTSKRGLPQRLHHCELF